MITRPRTLKDVADRSESLNEFGLNLRDWLHELRRASSRSQALLTIADEPLLLGGKFVKGDIADAWLASYAEYLAQKLRCTAPVWAFTPDRVAPVPVFDSGVDSPLLWARALAYAPSAFKRRNIFTPVVDLPLRLRAGRPVKSAEQKKKTNAERQRRFRKARDEELKSLRKLANKPAP